MFRSWNRIPSLKCLSLNTGFPSVMEEQLVVSSFGISYVVLWPCIFPLSIIPRSIPLFSDHLILAFYFSLLQKPIKFIVVAHTLSWMHGLLLDPSQPAHQKLSSYRKMILLLPIVIWLGVGLHAHAFPCWTFVWLELMLVLCMLSQLLWIHMCSSPAVSEKTLLLYGHLLPLACFLFLWWSLSLRWDTDALGYSPKLEGLIHFFN